MRNGGPKVFLINPANGTFGYSFITPRWLFVLASATPSDLVGDPVLIDETIKKFEPWMIEPGDIVGISITTGNCIPGYRVLREAKKRGATVIMGGIHATIFPNEVKDQGADAVVKGGGDIIWKQVVIDALSGKLAQGFRAYEGGRVPGEMLLPARWDLLDRSEYLKRSNYMFPSIPTVAGCPENCNFCSVWITEGRSPRQRLTEKIIDEVNVLESLGFPFIIFADDNFNPATTGRIVREQSPSKRKELEQVREDRMKFFSEYASKTRRRIPAFTQMTSEVVSDPEYLKAMHDQAGIRAALIGVESFNEEGLKSARKTWNPIGQKMVETIQTIQAHGIFVLSSIICGLATDTEESIRNMLDFAKRSGTLLAQFTLYSPFPGTVDFMEMMDDMQKRESKPMSGLVIAPKHKVQILYRDFWKDPNRPAVLIKHPNLDAERLVRLIRNSWDSFYSPWEILKRAAKRKHWSLKGKLLFFVASLGFKAMYAGYGFSADSVKTKTMTLRARLFVGAATKINVFLRERKRRRLS